MLPRQSARAASCRQRSNMVTLAPTVSMAGMSVQADGTFAAHRTLPEETPVAIVINGTTQAIMMATPDDLADFALGFVLSEAIVTAADQIESLEILFHDQGCEVQMWLRDDRSTILKERRRSMAGPVGCGLCGIDSLDQAMRMVPRVGGEDLRLDRREVGDATQALRAGQILHRKTQATHAAGLLVAGEGIVLVREDIGRHNALDKLIGALAKSDIDPARGAAVMTSRLSVDLVQKCAVAGLPAIIAVSAPTAHAVRLADQAGITLVAFARGGGFDTYSHHYRILSEVTDVA